MIILKYLVDCSVLNKKKKKLVSENIGGLSRENVFMSYYWKYGNLMMRCGNVIFLVVVKSISNGEVYCGLSWS